MSAFERMLKYHPASYHVVAGMLLYPVTSSSVYAAVCAVVSVNVIIAAFIYLAWNTDDEPHHSRTKRATAITAAAAAAGKLD